jgi:CarD family transcriptional regulator
MATAPVIETPVIETPETSTLTVQDNRMPPAKPAEVKPQDTKIPEVHTAEVRIAESRPMNGMPGARPMMAVRPMAKQENFVEGDYVVYPTHGVGKVEKIATEDIAGHRLELIHITFEENRMTLRVPVAKARTAGLRKLTSQAKFDEALTVLRGRARIKRTMWSRRAQEYEAKINSGDPIAIAEVVRDLHRNAGQPDLRVGHGPPGGRDGSARRHRQDDRGGQAGHLPQGRLTATRRTEKRLQPVRAGAFFLSSAQLLLRLPINMSSIWNRLTKFR